MASPCNCKNATCDCDELVEPNTGLALSAGTSMIVGARVTKGTARALATFCAENDCSQSKVIREFVVALAKSQDGVPAEADGMIAKVKEALGLEPEASRADINAALDALEAVAGEPANAPPADPNAAAAETPPPAPMALGKLNAGQISALAKRGLPATQEGWIALCNSTVRVAGRAPAVQQATRQAIVTLSKVERDYCARHNMTPAAFAAKKNATVKRVGGK